MSPVFDTFLADDSIVSTDVLGSPDGDLRLYPDLDQLVALAGQPGWAWAPVDRITQDGERHPACSRTFLRRIVADAAERHGITFRAAVEIELAVGRGRRAAPPGVRGGAVRDLGGRTRPGGGGRPQCAGAADHQGGGAAPRAG